MKYYISALFITFSLIGCTSTDIPIFEEPEFNASLHMENTTVEFDDLLHAENEIEYSVENIGEVQIESYTASLLQRKPGDYSATLLTEDEIFMLPGETKEFTYNWVIDGVPSSDEDGVEYELFVSIVDDNSIVIAESEPLHIEYSIPNLDL